MPTELLNGVQLHYDIVGTGDTVVLTHGSWGDGDGWQPTTDVLSRTYRVVTWDRRGHSRSEDGDGPGSIAEDVDDLIALIEHVADGPVHVVGNSFGSVIALRLATTRPDLVRSAAVHEPAALEVLQSSTDPEVMAVADSNLTEITKVTAFLEQGQYEAGAAQFMDHVAFGPGTWETYPQEAKTALGRNAHTFLDEMQEQPYGRVDVDGLADSDVPMLLTVGTESPEFLRMIPMLLSEKVPQFQVKWIDGAGHVPHATHPEPWAAVLQDFWNSL